MADLGGMFGYSFGGDFANSFAKGMQIGMMQRQVEMQEKRIQQDYEMNHLLKEEMGLKVRAQRNALEEANRYRQQWDEWKKPTEITHDIPAGGDEFSGPTDMRTETLIGPSRLQQMFPGQVGQMLEMGGPDMLKTIAPKLIGEGLTQKDLLNSAYHYDPESWATFTRTGKVGDLKPRQSDKYQLVGNLGNGLPVSYNPMTQAYSLPGGIPYDKNIHGEIKPKAENPYFTIVPTASGFTPFNAKTGTMGTPVGEGKPLPSEQVVAEQQIGTLAETLGRTRALYKPEYVGPIAGRLAGMKESTLGLSEEQAIFNATLAQMQNSLVYLMSGKQINEQEYVRLKRQLPDKNLPQSTFEARMNEFERTLNSIISNRKKNMGGYGSNVSQPKVSGKPPLSSFER